MARCDQERGLRGDFSKRARRSVEPTRDQAMKAAPGCSKSPAHDRLVSFRAPMGHGSHRRATSSPLPLFSLAASPFPSLDLSPPLDLSCARSRGGGSNDPSTARSSFNRPSARIAPQLHGPLSLSASLQSGGRVSPIRLPPPTARFSLSLSLSASLTLSLSTSLTLSCVCSRRGSARMRRGDRA